MKQTFRTQQLLPTFVGATKLSRTVLSHTEFCQVQLSFVRKTNRFTDLGESLTVEKINLGSFVEKRTTDNETNVSDTTADFCGHYKTSQNCSKATLSRFQVQLSFFRKTNRFTDLGETLTLCVPLSTETVFFDQNT